MLMMKSIPKPGWVPFLVVFGMETLHVIGVALLFFAVLPTMDTPMALMVTNGVAVLPGVLRMFHKRKYESWQG